MKTIKERMNEIYKEMSLIETKCDPTDADEDRFDELKVEFNKLKR